MLKASQKVNLVKKSPSVLAAEKKAREAEQRGEEVYNARYKYDHLISAANFLHRNLDYMLVSDPGVRGEEGLFEPEELALVPTQHLYRGVIALEETQELLASMIEQIHQALEARPD